MLIREERDKKTLDDFPKGAIVRVKGDEIDHYITSVANKLRDRIGEITGHQNPTPNPIVTFFAIGRRKEFKAFFSRGSGLELIEDRALIASWRNEVDAKRAKTAKVAIKRKEASK